MDLPPLTPQTDRGVPRPMPKMPSVAGHDFPLSLIILNLINLQSLKCKWMYKLFENACLYVQEGKTLVKKCIFCSRDLRRSLLFCCDGIWMTVGFSCCEAMQDNVWSQNSLKWKFFYKRLREGSPATREKETGCGIHTTSYNKLYTSED